MRNEILNEALNGNWWHIYINRNKTHFDTDKNFAIQITERIYFLLHLL